METQVIPCLTKETISSIIIQMLRLPEVRAIGGLHGRSRQNIRKKEYD